MVRGVKIAGIGVFKKKKDYNVHKSEDKRIRWLENQTNMYVNSIKIGIYFST